MIKKEDVERFLAETDWKENTQRIYLQILERYLNEWLQQENRDLATLDIVGFKSWVRARGWNENTRYLASVAVRQFALWCYGKDHPLAKLKLKRHKPGPQNTLDSDEARLLLASFDARKKKGIRDRAMAAFMLDTGVRAFEICGLLLKHLNLSGQMASLITKGGDWEEKVFSSETTAYLNAWLAIRPKIAREGVHTVFVSIGGGTPGRPLTIDGVKAIFRYIRIKTGIESLSPHALRRTMATLSIRNGAPTRLVQIQGGWSNVAMVERYTQQLTPSDFFPYFPVSSLGDSEAQPNPSYPLKHLQKRVQGVDRPLRPKKRIHPVWKKGRDKRRED